MPNFDYSGARGKLIHLYQSITSLYTNYQTKYSNQGMNQGITAIVMQQIIKAYDNGAVYIDMSMTQRLPSIQINTFISSSLK